MYKLFTAIAVCMAMQPAWAGGPGGGVSTAAHEAPPALVQVRLAAPGPATAQDNSQQAPIVVAALQDDTAPPAPEAETERDTNQGVLLAALALMAGIVLRRWGTGRQ